VLRELPSQTHPSLLVGAESGDDAAVWRLDETSALVSTVDFITPVVDDARAWGRVAATNSVSDIYAMGGRPLFALNVVGWNRDALGSELLTEVLLGGADVAAAAGFVVAGGHTIDDPEPKYGMAVTGIVDPAVMLTNRGLRDGQRLILTKPIGVGVITTAIKSDLATESMASGALESMTRLNDQASTIALRAGASGCTDVTGFGLLGHIARMAAESAVDIHIDVAEVPVLDGAVALIDAGVMAGGSRRNLDWVRDRVQDNGYDEETLLLLADAQTSGGLVFGVDGDRVDETLSALHDTGHVAAAIGVAMAGHGGIALA
jgi:selenide,water dikinase